MSENHYKVFVSHGTEDSWVASQIAKCARECGAQTFLDETNIPKGANFERIIHREIAASNELVALFTPSSAKRAWVWIEIGAAWILEKPVVAVFYGMSIDALHDDGQGKGFLEHANVLQLNDIEDYFGELNDRTGGKRDA